MRPPPVRWQLAHPSDMAPASPTHRRPWARRATRAVGGGGETAETLVSRPSQTTGQQVNPLSFLTKLLRQTRPLDERRWFLGTLSKESRISMDARSSLQWQCSEKGQQPVLPQGRPQLSKSYGVLSSCVRTRLSGLWPRKEKAPPLPVGVWPPPAFSQPLSICTCGQ